MSILCKRGLILVIAIGFLAFVGAAQADSTHRQPLIEAVHRSIGPLLTYLNQQEAFSTASGEELAILRQVQSIAMQSPSSLEYVDSFKGLQIQGGDHRLMATSSELRDPILVSREQLNLTSQSLDRISGWSNTEVEVLGFFMLLFHEYGHKTDEPNWQIRDSAARVFVQELKKHMRVTPVGEGRELIVLSLSDGRIDIEIPVEGAQTPQPSNVILAKQDGYYVDLTKRIESLSGETSLGVRSVWTEVNKSLYRHMDPLKKALAQAAEQAILPMMQFFGAFAGQGQMDDIAESMLQQMRLEIQEIRTLNIHDVQSVSFADNLQLVTLRVVYQYSRTEKNNFPIQITGWDHTDSFPVPMLISFVWRDDINGLPKIKRWNSSLRLDIDYSRSISVKRVQRHSGDLKLIVEVPEDLPPRGVFLSVRHRLGSISMPATAIGELQGGVRLMEFQVPHYWQNVPELFVAESVTFDGEKTHFLSRSVVLNEPETADYVHPRHAKLKEGSVGIWGARGHEPEFRRQFTFDDPVTFIDNVINSDFSLNPARLRVGFELEGPARVKEVRLHLSRTLMVLNVRPEDPQPSIVDIDGERVPIAHGGSFASRKQIQEIVTIPPTQIFHSETQTLGEQRVIAVTKVPFKTATPNLGANQAHTPPYVTPIMLEVVTESLETLRYYFSEEPTVPYQPNPCEAVLL